MASQNNCLVMSLVAFINPSQTGQWIGIKEMPFTRFYPMGGRKWKNPIFGVASWIEGTKEKE
jgi:hypothetical protein